MDVAGHSASADTATGDTASSDSAQAALRDRIAGVLVGTAAGDALGAGYEFTHPGPQAPIDMIGGGLGDFAPGEWTDDTSMALAVALAADEHGPGLDLDAVAAGFVRWYESGPPDIGVQTSKVLSGRPASATAMRVRSDALAGRTGGNGSLMRTAPVALVHLDDASACDRSAALVSLLTHSDPQAADACRLWTLGIRHAVLAANFDGVRAAVDTDTTAAIAGGLLGARWGASAVPARWRDMLHGYPELTGADLIALAERITPEVRPGVG